MYIPLLLVAGSLASLLVVDNQEPESEPAAAPFDLLSSGPAELESLLHFAIRHSDKSKLRELASQPEIAVQNLSHILDFMYAKDTWFEEYVNRTLIERSWTSLEEWTEAFDYIEDYGDHLTDKGEMLEALGALGPLLDWLVHSASFLDGEDSLSEIIVTRTAELVFGISQNRESTQTLILSHRPGIVRELFTLLQSDQFRCLNGDGPDGVCGAVVSVLYSLLGNNESMQHHMDEDMLVPLALSLENLTVPSVVFARIVSLFRVVQALSSSVDMQWKNILNWELMLSHVGTVDVFLGEQIVTLASNRGSLHQEALSAARDRLGQQCWDVKGSEHKWCASLQQSQHHTEL